MIIKEEENKQVRSAEDVAEIFRKILKSEGEIDQDKEHFWVIGLHTNNVIKFIDLVSLGTLNSSLVHPRETYRLACIKGVCSVIVVHNHPSGRPNPSRDDKAITKRLKEAGEILGIQLLDHIIIGGDNHFSFLSGLY